MFEFLLLLPIILFLTGLAAYLGMGLDIKQDTQIQVRASVWEEAARRGWWHHYDTASRQDGTWPAWDPYANGSIGVGADTGTDEKPRGTGDEFDFLYSNAGDQAMAITGNSMAQDYYRRIWNNLCGRHWCHKEQRFDTTSQMYTWLRGNIRSEYRNDSPTWVHGQLPPWLIAQHGPMVRIKTAFETHLAPVPPEFRRMAKELLHAWFEEEFLVGWNHPNAVLP